MSGAWGRLRLVTSLVLAAGAMLLLLPGTAAAHGLGDTTGASVAGFVWLGATHMLAGWDHLLFIGGALLVAGAARAGVKVLSLFAAGHSLTLLVATLAGWRVSATLVDYVIAASVAFAGFAALRGVRPRWPFTAAVFGFGLIHGLGLSTRLQDTDLPVEGLVARVLAFNVGVELGQVAAVAATLGFVELIRRMSRGSSHEKRHAVRQMAAALVVLGSVAAVAAVTIRDFVDGGQSPSAKGCVEGPRVQKFPDGGGHTTKQFFTPAQKTPMADFGHSLADGYVAFLYRPDLPEDDVAALRELVTAVPGRGVLAGPNPGQEAAVSAITRDTTLTCHTVDAQVLEAYATDYLSSSFR
jgi:hypothetical protein